MPTDVVSFGETMLRLTVPQGSRLEDAATLQVFVGGSESNTLSCLARLGLKVSWLSALPATPPGRRVDAELRRHGVDTSQVVWDKQNTRLGIFYVEESANPLGLQLYYDRANSACALINPEAVAYTALDGARLLHLTGITPALGDSAREVFNRLLAYARGRQLPLSFDVNYRARLWSASAAAASIENACMQASILFCARADATELWGFTGTPEAILQQMSRRFTTGNEPKRFVLTLGNEGSAQLYGDEYIHEPAIPTDGTVRFGSGDAFDAGYLYAYLQGPLYNELQQQLTITPLAFGNALAALKRCIKGDIAIITPEDVQILLQKQEGRRFR